MRKFVLFASFSLMVFLSYSQPRIEVLWGGNDSVLFYGVTPLIKINPDTINIEEIDVFISGNGILRLAGNNSYKIELLSKQDIYITLKRKGEPLGKFKYRVEGIKNQNPK